MNLENTLLQSNVAVTKGKEPLLVLQWVVGLFKCKQYEQIYEQNTNTKNQKQEKTKLSKNLETQNLEPI